MSSGQAWPGFSLFSQPLSPAALWAPLAVWPPITGAHCSLSVTLSPSIPTGSACTEHVRVSGHSGCSFPALLSPGHTELQPFCLPIFAQSLQEQGNGISFAAARAGAGRQKAHPPSLFQPHSPCWEPKGFKYLTSDIQKGCSFQKVDVHPRPDPRGNLQC